MAYVEYEADGKTVKARVKQKTDTLANWEANALPLLEGEQAFVVDSGGAPINFKIGDGTKRFSELPWWIQYDGGQYIQIAGNVLPEPTVDVGYSLVGPGTYTFAGQPDVVAPDGRLSQLLWDGSTWSLVDMGELPVVQGVDVINPVGEDIPKERAVAKYVEPIYNSVSVVSGKNILNPGNIKPNLIYVSGTGLIEDNSSWSQKGWLVTDIDLGSQYIYSGFPEGAAGNGVYVDDELNVVQQMNWSAPTGTTRLFTVPNNTSITGIFFNIPKDGSLDGSLQLEKGSSATPYEPYTSSIVIPADIVDFSGSEIEHQINDVSEKTDQVSDEVSSIDYALNSLAEEGADELTEVYEARSQNGYFNSSGNFVESENWRATIAYEVKSGDPGVYEGYGVSPVVPVMWWDINMENPTPILTGINNSSAPFTCPGDGFIVASYKAQDGDIQSLKLERPTYKLRPEAFSVDDVGFMPKVLWGKVGDEFRMYPAGIVPMMSDDTHLDFIWSLPRGNRDFVPVFPANTNDLSISASVRNGLGSVSLIGSTTIKVTKEVPTSPVSPTFVMCGFGDSLTNAPAWAQEFRHRLTGEGTEIGDAVNNVDPLGVSNITFIGSKTNIVPREGNGGWGYHNWLRNSSYGADTNPAWNPNTNEFDFEYYLDQLNVPGLNANGDNLVMYSLCLWNSVYTRSLETAIADMDELFQIIHAQKPGVKIKVMGLNTPPAKFIKPERGGQTPNTVMRDIIAYNQALQDYADANSDWVEFICISAQFHPEGCYPSADRAIHLRAADIQEKYATDHVHPNDRGYAQIADAAYYNFIYNYCN